MRQILEIHVIWSTFQKNPMFRLDYPKICILSRSKSYICTFCVYQAKKKLGFFPTNISVDQVSKNWRAESKHFNSLQFHRRKRRRGKEEKKKTNHPKMKPDSPCSTSFSGSFSKIRETVLSITQGLTGQMRTAKLLSSHCVLLIWEYRCQNIDVRCQALGSSWLENEPNLVAWFRLELLPPAPRQDQRMDVNCQVSSSANVPRRLCIFFLCP